jgi:hypothetical protein
MECNTGQYKIITAVIRPLANSDMPLHIAHKMAEMQPNRMPVIIHCKTYQTQLFSLPLPLLLPNQTTPIQDSLRHTSKEVTI